MDIRKREFNIRKINAEAADPDIKTQEFGKKYGLYLVAVFVLFIFIFVFILARWIIKSDSDAADVKKNLEAELLKNPVKTTALPAGQNSSASQNQAASRTNQTSQAAQTQASAADASASTETESSPSKENEGETEDDGVKKFESSNLRVSFDYPNGTTIDEGDNLITLAKDNKSWKIKFYDNKNKKEFEAWYKGHFDIEAESDCSFADAAVKVGSYASKLVKAGSDSVSCEGDGNYAISTDKSRVVKIEIGKETVENVNKILESFKFVE